MLLSQYTAEPGLKPMSSDPSLRLSVIIPILYIMRNAGNSYQKKRRETKIYRENEGIKYHIADNMFAHLENPKGRGLIFRGNQ